MSRTATAKPNAIDPTERSTPPSPILRQLGRTIASRNSRCQAAQTAIPQPATCLMDLRKNQSGLRSNLSHGCRHRSLGAANNGVSEPPEHPLLPEAYLSNTALHRAVQTMAKNKTAAMRPPFCRAVTSFSFCAADAVRRPANQRRATPAFPGSERCNRCGLE